MEKLFSPEEDNPESNKKRRAIFLQAIDDLQNTEGRGSPNGKSFELCLIRALCMVGKEEVFEFNKESGKLPPFYYAVSEGNTYTVRAVVEELQRLRNSGDGMTEEARGEFVKLLNRKYKNNTAFELAAANIRKDVVKFLLSEYPELVKPVFSLDSYIKKIIDATITTEEVEENTEKEEAALNAQRAIEIFELIVNRETCDTWRQNVWNYAVENRATSVLEHLLTAEKGASFKTKFFAKSIIEMGTYEIWRLFKDESLQDFFKEKEECTLLHDAVSSGQSEIVEDILKRFPDQIEVDISKTHEKQHYPLQSLARKEEMVDSSYDTIRNLLVHAMIRSNLAIREIKDIGNSSSVEVQSMSLHFSDIDTAAQSFAEFVASLKNHESSYLNFESVLKYTKFPDLNRQAAMTHVFDRDMFRTDHCEIVDAIEWLTERKVKEIMELTVPDRLYSPHSDDQVRACINSRGVRHLDWKKPDLYLPGLDTEFLRELHLYSSGNQSVIDQWCTELPKFKQLERLKICVIEDLVSDKRVKDLTASLKEKIDGINFGQKRVNIKIDSCKWMLPHEETVIYRNMNDITLDVAGKDLKKFITRFQDHYMRIGRETLPRIKIALIDSGVVVVSRRNAADQQPEYGSNISQRIIDGVSFVSKGNQEYLWWHASEPHGTQMATIICAMNPCCDLYVAKMAETKTSGLTAINVAKAIQWAIQKKVDIISLSLVVFGNQSKELIDAINLAKEENIVVICSTADEGYSLSYDILHKLESRPDKVISITACNQHGKPLDQSQEDVNIFRFSGDNIQIGSVPFLKSDSHVTGSSVATAIASATASLILSCCHISSNFDMKKLGSKHAFVCQMFRKMADDATSNQNGPWVRPHHLRGKNKLKDTFNLQTVINKAYNSEENPVW